MELFNQVSVKAKIAVEEEKRKDWNLFSLLTMFQRQTERSWQTSQEGRVDWEGREGLELDDGIFVEGLGCTTGELIRRRRVFNVWWPYREQSWGANSSRLWLSTKVLFTTLPINVPLTYSLSFLSLMSFLGTSESMSLRLSLRRIPRMRRSDRDNSGLIDIPFQVWWQFERVEDTSRAEFRVTRREHGFWEFGW